jgi:hypothetical protein
MSLAMLVLLLAGTAQPALSRPPAPASPHGKNAPAGTTMVYLPLMVVAPPAASGSSFDLIDQAVASDEISAEQGLIYKFFAEFSDARLPAQYVGTGAGREGDQLMEDVFAQAAPLSASARQTLTPFFYPPNDSRSWYYLPHLGAGAAAARPRDTPAGWQFKPTANGKVRVFYYSTSAADATKATQIAAQFDAIIYSKLTGLMQKAPIANVAGTTDIYLWDSYIDSNGTVVALSADELGITVGQSCDQSGVTIYLPDSLPAGSPYTPGPGLIQYATHEFMHAIQFAYTIQSCSSYGWLKEATATWAEDYVYPAVNSEQETAPAYLSLPGARLDSTSGMHDYGAYLLFYFLTHTVDTTASVIRDIWQNAAGNAISYQAIDEAVQQAAPAWKDLYWSQYLATLWNKAPFQRYYASSDGLAATVATAGGASIPISTPGGEQITPLYAQIPTGGALFFDLTFPDSSVRSLTILNGLGYNLSTGAPNTAYSVSGDETYLTNDLSATDLQGVNVELLLKASGQDADSEPYVLSDDESDSQVEGGAAQFDHCVDAQGPFDEVIVILSSSDWANPDRIMQPAGLPVTVYANNVPCYQVNGSFTASSNPPVSAEMGVTAEAGGTVTFGVPSDEQLPTVYEPWWPGLFPEIDLTELSLQATWKVSGADPSGCSWSGDGKWTGTEAAGGELTIEQGLLADGPTYRGYDAEADPDDSTDNEVTIACPNSSYTQTISFDGLRVDLSDVSDCGHIRVDSQGNLSGSCKMPYRDGGYEMDTWSLAGATNNGRKR